MLVHGSGGEHGYVDVAGLPVVPGHLVVQNGNEPAQPLIVELPVDPAEMQAVIREMRRLRVYANHLRGAEDSGGRPDPDIPQLVPASRQSPVQSDGLDGELAVLHPVAGSDDPDGLFRCHELGSVLLSVTHGILRNVCRIPRRLFAIWKTTTAGWPSRCVIGVRPDRLNRQRGTAGTVGRHSIPGLCGCQDGGRRRGGATPEADLRRASCARGSGSGWG